MVAMPEAVPGRVTRRGRAYSPAWGVVPAAEENARERGGRVQCRRQGQGWGPWGCSSTILAARRRVHLQHRSLSTGASRQQPELDAPTRSRIGGHAHAHRAKRC